MHSTDIQLRLTQEHRARQIAEAAEHRLACCPAPTRIEAPSDAPSAARSSAWATP